MTHRHFGIMSRLASFGGMNTDKPATRGIYAPRDLNPLPSQSILHCEHIPHPPLNLGRAIGSALFAMVTAVGLAVALFILFFVDLR